MIIGKLNATQAIAMSNDGKIVIMDMDAPWATDDVEGSPPEEDPRNVHPIKLEFHAPNILRFQKGA